MIFLTSADLDAPVRSSVLETTVSVELEWLMMEKLPESVCSISPT